MHNETTQPWHQVKHSGGSLAHSVLGASLVQWDVEDVDFAAPKVITSKQPKHAPPEQHMCVCAFFYPHPPTLNTYANTWCDLNDTAAFNDGGRRGERAGGVGRGGDGGRGTERQRVLFHLGSGMLNVTLQQCECVNLRSTTPCGNINGRVGQKSQQQLSFLQWWQITPVSGFRELRLCTLCPGSLSSKR